MHKLTFAKVAAAFVSLGSLWFAGAVHAVQFNVLAPGYTQEIYAAPLTPNQEAGMAWTSSGHLLTRAGSTIIEYDPTSGPGPNGTNVHPVLATHPITGLVSSGYGITNGQDGYIYAATGSGVQRIDPSNWAAPAVSLAGTVGGNGWGITTLTDGRIAYSDGGPTSNIYIYNPATTTNTLIYTAPELIDDIERGPGGIIALAGHQPTPEIFIISSTGSLINTITGLAHFPDGLAFGDGAASNSLFSNNNDGTISQYVMSGPGYTGTATITDIAQQTTGTGGAYGDLAAVGPDCAFYVSQYENHGSNGSTVGTGTHWDNGITTADASIVRIAAIGSDGLPICLFFADHEVPEPSTLVLAAVGFAGCGLLARRQQRRRR